MCVHAAERNVQKARYEHLLIQYIYYNKEKR